MKYVFVVSPTLKDADGVFGLIYAMAHRTVAPDDLTVTYIQPLYGDGEECQYDFYEMCARFRRSLPEEYCCKITCNTLAVSSFPDATRSWANGAASCIEECRGPACVFLDLGTVCENKETTALYNLLRDKGMADRCVLYAPSPDSVICEQWKEANQCNDFVVRRENVTRARAIYVPMRTRFCHALGISEGESSEE